MGSLTLKIDPDVPRGWLCPACGGGVAPNIHRCPCVALAPVLVPFVQRYPPEPLEPCEIRVGDTRPPMDSNTISMPATGDWLVINHLGQ